MALFQKSGRGGLWRPAQARLLKRHGDAAADEAPPAGFPTSEDEREDKAADAGADLAADPGAEHADPDANPLDGDPDTRFLAGETQNVVSSNVAWLSYERERERPGRLHVGYLSGSEYVCDQVDPGRALEIRHASSVGRALKALERSHGKFRRIA